MAKLQFTVFFRLFALFSGWRPIGIQVQKAMIVPNFLESVSELLT